MRWIRRLSLLAVLALAPAAWAGLPVCLCRTQCKVPPPPETPACPPHPCEYRVHLTLYPDSHAHDLFAALASPDWCERRAAVQKLGSRFHVDFCCQPSVLDALIASLQCDPCWHVRRAAAAGILGQKAATAEGVLALYVASKLDPHYLVRTEADQSLDILTVPAAPCYKPLLEAGDKLIKELRAKNYKPGSANCRVLFNQACGACGLVPVEPGQQPPPARVSPAPGPTQLPERIPEKLNIPRR